MDMPRVQIDQTFARIGMQHHRPQLSISQGQADLRIQQDLGSTLRMQTTDATLSIDQSAAFADADVKSIFRRNEEFANKANQQAMNYIAQTARDGDRMKKIESGANVIAELAKGKGLQPERQFELRNIPGGTEKVRISHRPSELSIQADHSPVSIHAQPHQTKIHAPKWEVNTYLAQKNQIQFSTVGHIINRQL